MAGMPSRGGPPASIRCSGISVSVRSKPLSIRADVQRHTQRDDARRHRSAPAVFVAFKLMRFSVGRRRPGGAARVEADVGRALEHRGIKGEQERPACSSNNLPTNHSSLGVHPVTRTANPASVVPAARADPAGRYRTRPDVARPRGAAPRSRPVRARSDTPRYSAHTADMASVGGARGANMARLRTFPIGNATICCTPA